MQFGVGRNGPNCVRRAQVGRVKNKLDIQDTNKQVNTIDNYYDDAMMILYC